jgi:hypothetical protein
VDEIELTISMSKELRQIMWWLTSPQAKRPNMSLSGVARWLKFARVLSKFIYRLVESIKVTFDNLVTIYESIINPQNW